MMIRDKAAQILSWYEDRARPFLEQHVGDSREIERIDKQGQRLARTAERATEEVAVCVLGHAGVGKSTLLNALVSDRHSVLPQGGVGPLTAQATVVRYADKPFFRVTYFGEAQLKTAYLILEKAYDLAAKSSGASARPLETDLRDAMEETVDAEVVDPSTEDGKATGMTAVHRAYVQQASLLLCGSQYGETDLARLAYLIDGLRVILGYVPRLGQTLSADDAKRAERVRRVLEVARGGSGPHHERLAEGDLPAFLADLRDHASGFLSPLIKNLEVGWDGESLSEGLILVDLPGIGIMNDEYRRVTTQWVRKDARVIVVVVDRAGVTDATASLLRDTGFFANLLHSSYDPDADPVTLAVAVVKLDLSADDAWRDERQYKKEGARKWREHFGEICRDATHFVRQSMGQELHKLAEEGAEENRTERLAAVEGVLATMQVFAVSAPELRKLAIDDEEERPRITAPEESNIPQMRAALAGLARSQHERASARANQALIDFSEHVQAKLLLLRAQWEAETRAEREAKQLSEDLESFLAPRRRELEGRRGAFREFLRQGIPDLIEARVSEATYVAQREIEKFLRRYEKMHWARLRAAVRKGGVHDADGKRHVDLPNELTLRFEEPVAIVWSKFILAALRQRTAQLGEDYVLLVGEVVDWAREQSARVQPRFVEALHADLVAQMKELRSIGKQAVDDLKKEVQTALYQRLEKRIRTSCEQFVFEKRDVGSGVRQRILELFRGDLTASVVDAARPIAIKVLLAAYRNVEEEIAQAFSGFRDPLESAHDAIVQSHEDSVRRSDAQRRKRVLESIETILSTKPEVTI